MMIIAYGDALNTAKSENISFELDSYKYYAKICAQNYLGSTILFRGQNIIIQFRGHSRYSVYVVSLMFVSDLQS